MLKLKIFLENSCVTKKLAYLYTMTNAQNNNMMNGIFYNQYADAKTALQVMGMDMNYTTALYLEEFCQMGNTMTGTTLVNGTKCDVRCEWCKPTKSFILTVKSK